MPYEPGTPEWEEELERMANEGWVKMAQVIREGRVPIMTREEVRKAGAGITVIIKDMPLEKSKKKEG
jgi:hypothetical protein